MMLGVYAQVVDTVLRHQKKQGTDPHPDALVFPNEKGGPHDTQNLFLSSSPSRV